MKVWADNMKTLVIIPAYCEQKKIYKVIKSVKSLGYDVLVVDDGSPDFTGEEALRAGARVLSHNINRGYGAALETGNNWALLNGYEVVVHFDADGQHKAGEIEQIISPVLKDTADVVIGSRFLRTNKTIPFLRKVLLKMAILFTWALSGIKLSDAHNGFRAISVYALNKIECVQDGMTYSSEIIDQIAEHNLRWREVPVIIEYTDYSKQKGEGNLKKISLGLKFIFGKIIK